MAKYLRRLDFRSKKDWVDLQREKWIEISDVPPELLDGWLDQSLSIWKIEGIDEVEQKSEIDEILWGLWHGIESKPDNGKISYILFDDIAVNALPDVEVKICSGNTRINHIDNSQKHYEIRGLTGKKICILVTEIIRNFNKNDINVYKKSDYEAKTTDKLNEFNKIKSRRGATSITAMPSEGLTTDSSTYPTNAVNASVTSLMVQGSSAITSEPILPPQSGS